MSSADGDRLPHKPTTHDQRNLHCRRWIGDHYASAGGCFQQRGQRVDARLQTGPPARRGWQVAGPDEVRGRFQWRTGRHHHPWPEDRSVPIGPGRWSASGKRSNPLDLAIAGNGYFTAQAADGSTRYTRDGGFHADVDGSLRTRDGSAVLDTNSQPIVLPIGTDVSVAADGTVSASGNNIAQLQMVDIPAGQTLNKVGNGMFTLPAGVQPQAVTGAQVYQGYLEGSNTDMTESMVSTMNLIRAYEANQKMLQMQDETLKSTVNEVGKA